LIIIKIRLINAFVKSKLRQKERSRLYFHEVKAINCLSLHQILMMSKSVRVRFAPSPTGPRHPGGVRTALFNYLLARQLGGTFILRIEDTDQTRFVPGAEQFIIESLAWCGIEFDEGVHMGGPHGPYRQSERKAMYRQYADMLIEKGHAYYAFDTEVELEEMRERLKKANVASPQYNSITRVNMKNSLSLPADEVQRRLDAGDEFVIRFKMPRNEEVRVKDMIRGWVVVNTSQLDDKVLFKSDGMPTYHLANVVDDFLMEISHVIRGEEWLPSTPLHVLLYQAFGWEAAMPEFAHLPLLLKPDGDGKLSKRDGDRLGLPFYAINWTNPETGETTLGYRETGYFPEAYINFLSLLGWNPGDNREIFSLEELVQAFSLERVNKHGARYDFGKLNWFNQQYLRSKPHAELAEMVAPQVVAAGHAIDMTFITEVCRLMNERMTLVSDFYKISTYFFVAPSTFEAEVAAKRWKDAVPGFAAALKTAFEGLSTWDAASTEACFNETATAMELKPGQLMQAYRLAVSGQGAGPAIFELTALLGQKEIAARLQTALNTLGHG
jgi:glutamyl-tRNA synthetase